MKDKEITKAAYNLLKHIKRNICYTSLCEYITSKGFIVVELHTDKGDDILKRFDCYDRYKDEKRYNRHAETYKLCYYRLYPVGI